SSTISPPTTSPRSSPRSRPRRAGRSDPVATVELVATTLSFTPEQPATILDHFIRGGQPTAGGIMQAVISAAQTVADADVAHAREAAGLRALDIAAHGQ